MNKKICFFIGLITILLLSACGTTNEQKNDDNDVKLEQQEEPINVKIDVGEELKFKLFDVIVKSVKVYEKDNSLLADFDIQWTNRDYQYGDKKSFFVSTLFDVKQGERELVEINDAWNVIENKNSSDVFFPNAAGGKWSIKLTYELVDKTTPIDIMFYPTTETEGTETITINIP